jgi:hypothetical protein
MCTIGQYYKGLALYIRNGVTVERLKQDVYPEDTFVMHYVKQKLDLLDDDPLAWVATLDDARMEHLVSVIHRLYRLESLCSDCR